MNESMDKAQKELLKSYWHNRKLEAEMGGDYEDYEICYLFTTENNIPIYIDPAKLTNAAIIDIPLCIAKADYINNQAKSVDYDDEEIQWAIKHYFISYYNKHANDVGVLFLLKNSTMQTLGQTILNQPQIMNVKGFNNLVREIDPNEWHHLIISKILSYHPELFNHFEEHVKELSLNQLIEFSKRIEGENRIFFNEKIKPILVKKMKEEENG